MSHRTIIVSALVNGAVHWLVGSLTSSSTTRLSRGWVSRLALDNFKSRKTTTSVLAGLIIKTLTQPVEIGRKDQTHDLLTRSRAFYSLSYTSPPPASKTVSMKQTLCSNLMRVLFSLSVGIFLWSFVKFHVLIIICMDIGRDIQNRKQSAKEAR